MLDLEENGYDVVFSNWLLMYLDDDEVADLASDALAWVHPLFHALILFFHFQDWPNQPKFIQREKRYEKPSYLGRLNCTYALSHPLIRISRHTDTIWVQARIFLSCFSTLCLNYSAYT